MRAVRARVSLTTQRPHRKSAPKPPRRLDTARLKDPVTQQLLSAKIKYALERAPLEEGTQIDRMWGATRDAIYKASFDSVGTTKRRHQDWFDENDQHIQNLLENKRTLHQMTLTPNASEEDKSRYRDACHEVQAKLRVMKDEWWDAKATEVQGFADRHEEKEFYSALKEVYGPTH